MSINIHKKNKLAFPTCVLNKAILPWQAYITVKITCQKNKLVLWIWLECWPTVWQITILPQVLNTLSAGVLVAGIQRYFLANWQTCGELTSCSFRRRGWVSLSAGGVCKELFSSALIASVTHSPEFAIIFFSWKRVQRFSFSVPLIFASAAAALAEDPEGAVTLFSDRRGTLTLCTEMLKH